MTTEEYCRELEAYLCRKNDGHLIRIVGPSFERVCSWAAQGIPFKIACQGVDRYFVRYYAKGPRRRPVQIEFCENDVVEAFEAWRRTIGVRLPGVEGSQHEVAAKQRKRSLREHLDRVCERITARLTAVQPPGEQLERVLEQVTSEASAFRDWPSPVRGEARERAAARLAELDRILLDTARAQAAPALLLALREEAEEQLLPFRERMPADAYARALDAAVDGLIREREKLPVVGFA